MIHEAGKMKAKTSNAKTYLRICFLVKYFLGVEATLSEISMLFPLFLSMSIIYKLFNSTLYNTTLYSKMQGLKTF